MPEFVEVEAFRRTALPLLGRRIDGIDLADERLLRRGDAPARVFGVVGDAEVEGLRRVGKVLLFDLSGGHSMALTFGLRGRLVVDGRTARADGRRRRVRVRPQHVRVSLASNGHALQLEDQLRMATLEIDFDESRLGVDVLAIDKRGFRALLDGSQAAVKSRLMDQRRLAGVGNLIADEVLFQGGIDPRRPCADLDEDEIDALWRGFRRTRERVLERCGSHRGILIQDGGRRRGGRCPRCDVPIRRAKVGGRTSYFCPGHQG